MRLTVALLAIALFGITIGTTSTAGAEGNPAQVVCRTTSPSDGTTELVLEWQGNSAKGALKRTAPSGTTYEQKVKAERAGSTIIADDINEKDLVNHVAVVREDKGKKYMRSGDGSNWLVCN